MTYHMRDSKNLRMEREARDEAQILGGICLFYLCVLVTFIVVW
jgi:hypothetical protein